MAKTCRTCRSASRVLKCDYGWPCYGGPVVCEDHKRRETPLLVDELAEALLAIGGDVEGQFEYLAKYGIEAPVQESDVTLQRSYSEDGRYTYPSRRRLLCAVVDAALTRYQKEVGDA